MLDRLSSEFEARRPLLQHVADRLRDELTEALTDAGANSSIDFHVETGPEFIQRAKELGDKCRNPLVELVGQISGRILVATIDDVTVIESAIDDYLSIVSRDWVEDRVAGLPSLRLHCVIPPQAKPDGWKERNDVPAVFALTIGCRTERTQEKAVEKDLGTMRSPSSDKWSALVMKGGGIKGLAYVGAVEELSRCYTFNWFVGTSAGAIAAVLLGAGYSVRELQEVLQTKDFRDFFDASFFRMWINLVFYHGLYPADSLTTWLDTLLAKKLQSPTRVRLSELPFRVTVYASQRGRHALKFDSFDNDAVAAYAVRCSMSIPFVFIPQSNQGVRAYDGGLQHNYPVEELLRAYPNTPFVSLFLGPEIYEPVREGFVFADLFSIWLGASDPEVVAEYRDNTVVIDPRPIRTLDFALTNDEKEFLLACGRAGALAHLERNSEAHSQAERVRDALKERVKLARTIKRRRRLVIALLLCLSLGSVWALWAGVSNHR